MSIDDALERFLLQLEADGRSPHTIAQYRRHIRVLSRWLVQEERAGDIGDIIHEDIARFLVSRMARNRPDGKPKRATALNALRTSLRVFFSYLHRAGYINRDPARLVRRARCGTPPPKGLSPADQEKLLAALARDDNGRDHCLIHLLLATGIRIGSALALEVEDRWLRTLRVSRASVS